jgi:hypothetical protein
MNYDDFIGQEVIHVHRCEDGFNYQTGVLVGVMSGVNTLLGVRWRNDERTTWMPPQDIALKSKYPESRF